MEESKYCTLKVTYSAGSNRVTLSIRITFYITLYIGPIN